MKSRIELSGVSVHVFLLNLSHVAAFNIYVKQEIKRAKDDGLYADVNTHSSYRGFCMT